MKFETLKWIAIIEAAIIFSLLAPILFPREFPREEVSSEYTQNIKDCLGKQGQYSLYVSDDPVNGIHGESCEVKQRIDY